MSYLQHFEECFEARIAAFWPRNGRKSCVDIFVGKHELPSVSRDLINVSHGFPWIVNILLHYVVVPFLMTLILITCLHYQVVVENRVM